MVKVKRRTSYFLDHDGKEYEINHHAFEHIDPIFKPLSNGGLVIGYCVHDQDCQNPLDDCDGMGKIYDRRRHASREDLAAFAEAIGTDLDWNPDPEKTPNPYAVFLTVYDHSGESWSVGSSIPACDPGGWDTSRGAGVYVPDSCCKEHIETTARERLLDFKVEYKSKPNPDGTVDPENLNVITVTMPDGSIRTGFKSFEEASAAAEKELVNRPNYERAFGIMARQVAVECAQQAVTELNKWLSGDCYGVCVETFDKEGERTDEEACWGFIGHEYAEQEMKDGVESQAKHAEKKIHEDNKGGGSQS